MVNTENNAEPGNVVLTSQINILPSRDAEDRTENDPITSIVKEMLVRENENEQATKKLKELIRREGKKQFQMSLTIQVKISE